MAIKKIYVNPGDTVEIRVINDSDEEKTAKNFEYLKDLHQAGKMIVGIGAVDTLSFSQGLVPRINILNGAGELIAIK